MRAQALAVPAATVTLTDTVSTALRILAEHRLPGLVVTDEKHRPKAVLPGTQALRMGIALEFQEDAALARVVDEASADIFTQTPANRLIGECLPPRPEVRAVVTGDATLLEVACLMARTHSPLVAVIDGSGAMTGIITLSMVLERLGTRVAAS